jgi:HlyD family secretion protein
MTSRRLTLISVLAACGIGAAALGPRSWRSEADSPRTDRPRSTAVRSIQGIGYTEPVSEIRRMTFKIDGTIAACPVEIGQTVKAGEVLMKLDDAEEQAAVAVARAELDLAEAELQKVLAGTNPHEIAAAEKTCDLRRELLALAARRLQRIKVLTPKKTVAEEEVDEAESRAKQAKASLEQQESQVLLLKNSVRDEDRILAAAKVRLAKSRFQSAEERLAKTVLAAPCDGTVLDLLKREGDGLRMGDMQPAVIFGDVSRLRVRAEIDERHVIRLRKGQKATIFGRNLGDRRCEGIVATVKGVMGDKRVFTQAPDERKDLDVVEVLIDMEPDFTAPAGLRVDVAIDVE